ncbi:MAG: ATP-binding protein [Tannerellaceae bacterium]|nr:ATP-binding protein [Tannerellaceae bacterium]
MIKHTLYQLPIVSSDELTAALGSVHLGVSDGKLMVLIGPPGSGKTTIVFLYENEEYEIHYILCSPTMRMKDVLRALAYALDIHAAGSSYEMQAAITRELPLHPNHCFMLDECEYLNKNDISKLEVIRQIWDQTRVPFILIGTDKLEDELKGTNRKGTVNHPQIYRRLCKTRLGPMKQAEIVDYLDLLEQEYAVRFTQEARRDLVQLCLDRNNGGMGNFIEVLELALILVRPEWKAIGYQLNQKTRRKTPLDRIAYDPDKKEFTSEAENTTPETEASFEPVDVSQLKQVTISHEVIISAMDYKMTK